MEQPIAATPTAPSATPTAAPVMAATQSPEAIKIAQWVYEDVASGAMTPEQGAQAMKELNGETIETEAPVDTGLLPPHEYQLSREALNDPSFPAKDVQNYLSMAGFEKSNGSSLGAELHRVAQASKSWAPGGPEENLFAQKEHVKLERVLGPDYKTRLEPIRQIISNIEKIRPGIVKLLEDTRAGDSAMVISSLIYHYEGWLEQHKGRT